MFLSSGAILFGLLVSNISYIFFIRSVRQKTGFPRYLLSGIPTKTITWIYPDVIDYKKDSHIAIIGDSYVAGNGDAFLNNLYNYSFLHHLYLKTPYSFLVNGNPGSFLDIQIKLFEASKTGSVYPLLPNSYTKANPSGFILSFYEGNDLDDFYQHHSPKVKNKKQLISVSERYIPLISYLEITINKYKAYLVRGFKRFVVKDRMFLAEENLKKNSYSNKICIKEECFMLPPMQSASPELSDAQIKIAVDSIFSSIDELRHKYDLPICLLYIPSPATIYSPKKIVYQKIANTASKNNDYEISSNENISRSKFIRNSLKEKSLDRNIQFLDSTEYLTSKARIQLIHGNKDPNHFNFYGYKFLAEFITPEINSCTSS